MSLSPYAEELAHDCRLAVSTHQEAQIQEERRRVEIERECEEITDDELDHLRAILDQK
jgi:hypothetical protein